MNSFKDFGIITDTERFVGDKIRIDKILDKEIIIHKYKIKDSTKKDNTLCLYLQIETNNEKRVVFTGGGVLISVMQQMPKENLPFKTTIIKESDQFKFT